ncbi:MAG TPA: Ig-like domain-containing protein [Baekduia sp.]
MSGGPGVYTVTASATDSAANEAVVTRDITVTTAPVGDPGPGTPAPAVVVPPVVVAPGRTVAVAAALKVQSVRRPTLRAPPRDSVRPSMHQASRPIGHRAHRRAVAFLLTAATLLALGSAAGPAGAAPSRNASAAAAPATAHAPVATGAAAARHYPVPAVASAPARLAAGAAFRLPVTLRNPARTTTSAATVALYLAPAKGSSRGTRVAVGHLRAVKRAGHATLTLRARIPTATRAGTYALLTCVLHGKVVPKRASCVAARHAVRVTAAPAPAQPLPAVAAPTPPLPTTPAPPALPPAPIDGAPIAHGDAATAVAGKTLTVRDPGVLGNDTDPDGDGLSAAVATPPAHGTLVLNSTGGYTYTSDADFSGTDTFTYTASDGTVRSAPATVTIQVSGAALGLTAVVDHPEPLPGGQVTFTLRVTNAGPDAATGVTVAAPLPFELAFTIADGDYDSASGEWTVGSLASGASATLQIVAHVTDPAPAMLIATIDHADQPDPDPADDSATVSVTPQRADVSVAVSADQTTVHVGHSVTFTVVVTNDGPDTATGLELDAAVPSAMSSATADSTDYDAGTGSWSIASLASGASATLHVTADADTVATDTFSATVAHLDQYDHDTADQTGTVDVAAIQEADVSISTTVDDATPDVGDHITFTIDATNNGPDASGDVSVSALLPAGLTIDSAVPSAGSYDATTGAWTVGTLASAGDAQLTIVAAVAGPDPATLSTTIAQTGADDPVPGNEADSATVTPLVADLAADVSVNPSAALLGSLVVVTMTVTNAGPSTPNGATASLPLPSGLVFSSASPTQGTYDPGTGTWTIGSLASGTTATLTINATAVQLGTIPITGTASSATFDPSTADNESSTSVEVL